MTPSEIPRIARSHVRALEVAHEDLDQVGPVVDVRITGVSDPRGGGGE